MTKEELEKEAREKCVCKDEAMQIMYRIGYIDGAGPREKRIAELEGQIEKMKCCYNCSKWYDGECEESPKSKTFFCADFKCDNWEIADD